MTYKPFPPLRNDEHTTVSGEEARAINKHCELMGKEIERLRTALDDIFMIVSYVNVHGVGEQPPSNGLPQPVRVAPDEFKRLFQKIGDTAREALAEAKVAA